MNDGTTAEKSLDCEKLRLEGVWEFTRVESNRARPPLPRHAHEGRVEIDLFQRGIQAMEVSGEEYTVMGGDAVIVPEGAEHSSAMQPQYRTSLYRLLVDVRPRARLMGLSKRLGGECLAALAGLTDVRYRAGPALADMAASAFERLDSPDAARRRRGEGDLIRLLLSLEDELRDPSGGWRDKTVKAAMEYINDNITQRLELADVAERVGTSLSHFKARFRAQTGVSPMYYINWRKIAYAKRLIAQRYSVTDAAMRLSFNSSSYFSTVFRNITSRTPLQYRRFVEEEMLKQRHPITMLRLPDDS